MSWLLLIDGAIEVCNERGECGLLDEPGKLIRITPDGAVGDPVTWASLEKDGVAFDTAFPFVVTPPQVDPDPIFTPDDIISGDVTEPEDNGGGREGGNEGTGPDVGPGPPGPPLTCWSGWKEVPRGWSNNGWRVKHKRRGDRVIFCAHPEAPLPPGPPGDGGLPQKPLCVGGKLIALKVLPPRWSCVCPDGKTRHQIGKHAFVCKGGRRRGRRRQEGLPEEGLDLEEQPLPQAAAQVPAGLLRHVAQLQENHHRQVPAWFLRQAAQVQEDHLAAAVQAEGRQLGARYSISGSSLKAVQLA